MIIHEDERYIVSYEFHSCKSHYKRLNVVLIFVRLLIFLARLCKIERTSTDGYVKFSIYFRQMCRRKVHEMCRGLLFILKAFGQTLQFLLHVQRWRSFLHSISFHAEPPGMKIQKEVASYVNFYLMFW